MSPIRSLIITQVYSSAEYIADTFQRKGLATIIRILLLPYSLILKNPQEQCNLAIIDIHEWHDTEDAYNFISQLNNGNVVKLSHNNYSESWAVARNLFICLSRNINQYPYVVHFNVDAIQEDDYDNLVNVIENEPESEPEQWRGVNLESAFQLEL